MSFDSALSKEGQKKFDELERKRKEKKQAQMQAKSGKMPQR